MPKYFQHRKRWLYALIAGLLSSGRGAAKDQPLHVSISLGQGITSLNADGLASEISLLEAADDLTGWSEIAKVRGRLERYGDWGATGKSQRFYRGFRRPITLNDDWTNQLEPATSDFFTPASGTGAGAIRSAKFSLILSQPDRIYFQDTAKWPFHYHFAHARLPGYETMSVLAFSQQALYANANQRMVVGTVLRAPDPQVHEVGIEITGAEAFPGAQAAGWVEAVKRRLVLDPAWRVFYLPSAEQQAATEFARSEFEARGIAVGTLSRWISENVCYSADWALGRLAYVPGGEVSAALADGRLGFGDILVTDRVPAELPVLAGYLCLQPATPNSHVALLARSLRLPFAHANGAGLQGEIAALAGREVLLVVKEVDGRCEIQLTDTTTRLTAQARQAILDLKTSGPLAVVPKRASGTLLLPVDGLTPADLDRTGGKASNFGFLRRSLPTTTPAPAMALTFDLWDAYLDRPVPGTLRSLRQEIAARLARHTYPPNVNLVRGDLLAIQSLIRDRVDFAPETKAALLQALSKAGFTPARKLRFRSSTNVEDSDVFSGAGLYDSFSGCLADDQDDGTSGPSLCDPTEATERGVFRAIRRVYASFYNENAFLERLRHRVNENDVGMAVLVHYSSPDADELANGVATLAIDKTTDRVCTARLVTQLGAASVTNPDGSVRAETVTAFYRGLSPFGAAINHVESSSLTPDGGPVMTLPTDYETLLDELNTAALAFEAYYPHKTRFELDFEFKRTRPGVVGLKQIREVPHPTPVPAPILP